MVDLRNRGEARTRGDRCCPDSESRRLRASRVLRRDRNCRCMAKPQGCVQEGCPFRSLEKTPVRKKEWQVNYGLRSSSLHKAANSQLLGRAFLVALLAVPLTCSVAGVLLILDYVFNLYTAGEYLPIVIYVPIAMWLVAGIFAVARFLSYIDVRIRQEGWEVELRLRAEALRLEKGVV